jgi:hypothetical protein
MEAAGYKFSGRAQCGSKLCLAPILWVRRPNGSSLTLDEPQMQPHEFTCKDPGWRARRKQRQEEQRRQRAQTSARRRRAS